MLRNTKGHVHIFGILMMLFALIGMLAVYRSYQEQKLKDDFVIMLNDLKSIVTKQEHKQIIEQLLQKIHTASRQDIVQYIQQVEDIVKQYNNGATINIQKKIKT